MSCCKLRTNDKKIFFLFLMIMTESALKITYRQEEERDGMGQDGTRRDGTGEQANVLSCLSTLHPPSLDNLIGRFS